jgi:hypothetical protein
MVVPRFSSFRGNSPLLVVRTLGTVPKDAQRLQNLELSLKTLFFLCLSQEIYSCSHRTALQAEKLLRIISRQRSEKAKYVDVQLCANAMARMQQSDPAWLHLRPLSGGH